MKSNGSQPGTSFYEHPVAALVAVQILFGVLPVIGKFVLATIPAVAFVGLRIAISALLLSAVQLYRKRIWLQERADYWRLAVLSLFGIVLNQLLFIGGLSLTKASNVSLLVVTIPIFTIIISSVIGSEKLNAAKIVGIMLAAAGVILLIDPRAASFSSETTLGDLMIILNSFAYGIYVAASKDVMTRNGAVRSATWVFIFASVICIPLGLVSLSRIDVASVPSQIWLIIVFIAIFATALPYLLNAWAIARVSPSTVAVFVYLQPIIGFILAVIFLGEVLDFRFIIATLLVFAGLFLTMRKAAAVDMQVAE